MIKTNYQSYGSPGFNLRLRLYQDGETRYLSVNYLLQGNLSKRHWNAKKQLFIPSAPFSKENNEALVQFKRSVDEKALNWQGNLYNLLLSLKTAPETNKPLVSDLFNRIIEMMKKRKHADGTTRGSYEAYEKLCRRLLEFCGYKKINYDRLFVEDLTAEFINAWFDYIDSKCNGSGMVYISTTLHAAIGYAEKFGWHSMGALKGVRWAKKVRSSAHKYDTLTPAQCNRFLALSSQELPPNPKKTLYRDFCVFILYTGQSPCDAIALKYSDIKVVDGVSHFIFKRRKISEKQAVPCAVPINSVLQEIMDKWKPHSQDGYIFPIRNKQKIATQATNNGDIKHFIGRINVWLKKLGKILGCDFPLHTYTFRHTAITNYISKNVPVIYVANMMGTSVDNCEKIYYNNQGDAASRNKILSALKF